MSPAVKIAVTVLINSIMFRLVRFEDLAFIVLSSTCLCRNKNVKIITQRIGSYSRNLNLLKILLKSFIVYYRAFSNPKNNRILFVDVDLVFAWFEPGSVHRFQASKDTEGAEVQCRRWKIWISFRSRGWNSVQRGDRS